MNSDLLRRFGFAVSRDKWLYFARSKNDNILYQHLSGKQITEFFKVKIDRVYKTCHSNFYNSDHDISVFSVLPERKRMFVLSLSRHYIT